MLSVNENYSKIKPTYLFAEIAHRVQARQAENPSAKIIRLGIGDVTEPLCEAVIKAMHKAVDEESSASTFHRYGPEQGYGFLREKIASVHYGSLKCDISPDEVFVSDGAKCDCGNIQELFANKIKIAVSDPVYPVYVDTNIMAGREDIILMPCTKENGFVPAPDSIKDKDPDVVYLCYPNNPTGAVATTAQLQAWVDWANENSKLILFDAAYEAFIRTPGVPRSIYECEGAKKCAIEFSSYSKTAGFTGIRCGYTVVPSEVFAYDSKGEKVSLRQMWLRRQTTKFNGASFITQRGAEAIYSIEGQSQTRAIIDFYLENARLIRTALLEAGFECFGGVDSPYVWVDVKGDSWDFFDRLLTNADIVTTPGAGFGKSGEGFIRISAFNTRENVLEAIERFKKVL
jgi:LL-diaminopimelate aminotransferase